jgi:hypothetical protein
MHVKGSGIITQINMFHSELDQGKSLILVKCFLIGERGLHTTSHSPNAIKHYLSPAAPDKPSYLH